MRLDEMLQNIRGKETVSPPSTTEKIASETVSSLDVALKSALAEIKTTTDKTASVTSSPANDVMKIAQEMIEMEKEAAVKEATLLGHAFADAVVARFSDWNSKLASVPTSNPSLSLGALKQAQEQGYSRARSELEKQATDLYNKGYEDTVNDIHACAASEFMKAAQITEILIRNS